MKTIVTLLAAIALTITPVISQEFEWATDPAGFEWKTSDVVAPKDAAAGEDGRTSERSSPVNKPVMEVLIPDGNWCGYCNWWKVRDKDGDLPVDLEFVVTSSPPVYGWPTFRIPKGADGNEWFISNSSEEAVISQWRKLAGTTEAQEPEAAGEAAEAPTPHSEIAAALEAAKPSQTIPFVDIGCGDARILIEAVQTWGVRRAIGYEIDPEQAALARARVEAAGLGQFIEIIEADATQVDLPDNAIVYCYLYPPLLEVLKVQLMQSHRVVSRLHKIEGLPMRKVGKFYVWERGVSQQASGRPYALYNGWKFYSPCCNDGSCGMRREIVRQLNAREHVE